MTFLRGRPNSRSAHTPGAVDGRLRWLPPNYGDASERLEVALFGGNQVYLSAAPLGGGMRTLRSVPSE